ncbi:MAG: polyphenol oxidase family protein [candidate division WOR-3 bacterium]
MEWVIRDGYYELVGVEPFVGYFSTKLGFPPVEDLVFINQLHTGIVQIAPAEPDTPGDALITARRGVFISVKTADCAPVFIFDPRNLAFGLAHAGWRGAFLGVHLNALGLMSSLYGTVTTDVLVAIGPTICASCYRVGEEMSSLFSGFVRMGKGAWFFDLPGYIGSTLIRAGILPDNIIMPPACTMESFWLWSARRDGHIGRNWAIAGLR